MIQSKFCSRNLSLPHEMNPHHEFHLLVPSEDPSILLNAHINCKDLKAFEIALQTTEIPFAN